MTWGDVRQWVLQPKSVLWTSALAAAVLILGGVFVAKGPWSAEAASWVQAIGSIFAVAIAIYVPARLERDKVAREDRALWDSRRQAWRTMYEVTDAIARRGLVRPGEIEALSAILDHLDLSIFPERAISVLIILRNEAAMAASAVQASGAGGAVGNPFHGDMMRNNMRGLRDVMGVTES